ncbi:hypothetical protein DIPPA_11458 [Diplonema papillatum]|nr:hypothetical protein DIPPA_14176 [Diplonema papillatum]KAJ9446583.1 hypothetical protein DIPPA_11458 [Diplonema papillatum]
MRDGARPILDGDPGLPRGLSRFMLRHLPTLESYGVVRARTDACVVLPAFTVEKKSGGLRLVADGRKLNALMKKPPAMLLPGIDDVVSRFLASKFVAQADAVSWFYQFPLEESVSRFFGMNLSGPRGRFTKVQLSVMCMGWNWAPCIAQRTARVLLPESEGVCWVDNFFVIGTSYEEAERRYRRFQHRCQLVGAAMNTHDSMYGRPLSRFEALGLEFDLGVEPSRYRSAPSWVKKFLGGEALAPVMGGSATPRQVFTVFGGVVWFLFSTRRRLCFLRSAMAFLRRAASLLGEGTWSWDDTYDVPSSALYDLRSVLADLSRNEWVTEVDRDRRRLLAWSDASDSEWAVVLETRPELAYQGVFLDPSVHIYLKELLAATQAVWFASLEAPGSFLVLKVDNQAAVFALKKGHSKNFWANEVLCLFFKIVESAGLIIDVVWVPTDVQRADKYTRGCKAFPGSGLLLRDRIGGFHASPAFVSWFLGTC